jgi:hypothetical protein
MAEGTVEFNADRPPGWLDRLLGEPDREGRRRVSGPALGCGVLTLALVLAAELLPWAVNAVPTSTSDGPSGFAQGAERHVEEIAGFVLVPYYFGWLGLITLLGLALAARGASRRLAVGSGLGLAAAQLVLVAGLTRRVLAGGEVFGGPSVDASLGPGVFFAFVGVLVAAATFLLTGWRPGLVRGGRGGRGGRDRRPEPEEDTGPADLTVTPIP